MAYDKDLAQRIREALGGTPGLTERAMFGGIGFMVHGNMACGILNEELMVRVGPERHGDALARPHVRVFDLTGRPMKGWVVVSSQGLASADSLRAWLDEGVAYAKSLPEK